jgi:uncharacterized membrane protein YfcA
MLVLSGFLTGLIVGLTGVGGGALMTPLLLLFFGVAPATAIGTDLWFAAITKIVAGGVHHSKGLIDWQILRRLWWGSLPASGITIILMRWEWLSLDTSFLKQMIAYLVLITVFGIFFQKRLYLIGKKYRLTQEQSFKKYQPGLTVLAGAILGFLVTFTSIGAGALGAVMMLYLYPLRLTPVKLVATDIVHAVPLALFAGMGHLLIGHVDFELLGTLLLGSVPGVYLGAKLSAFLPARLVKLILAIVLLAVALKLLLA